jgi:GntR family transcriptional regulator
MIHKKGVTLYSRVESILRNRILSGQYEPGEKLPTVNEMASQFEVSKITVRGAVERLQREGLLLGRSGKGVFVAEDIPVPKQLILTGNVQSVLAEAERYAIEVLEPRVVRVEEARIAKDLRAFFRVQNGHEVTCFRRVRMIKDVPIYFVENFVPIALSQFITREDLRQKSLLRVLKQKGQIEIGRGEMYFQAVPGDVEIAELLHCPSFDPLIQIQVCFWLPSGEPLEMANEYVRPDYFKYKVDIDMNGFRNLS